MTAREIHLVALGVMLSGPAVLAIGAILYLLGGS